MVPCPRPHLAGPGPALQPAAGDDPAPPRLRSDQPAGMVSDLVAGDLAAGYALLEWLDERDREPFRRHQATVLRMAIGTLVSQAMVVAEHAFPRRVPADVSRPRPFGPEAVWRAFVVSVTELFGTDLYHPDDVIRFVSAVIRPGAGSRDGAAAA